MKGAVKMLASSSELSIISAGKIKLKPRASYSQDLGVIITERMEIH